MPAIPHRWIPYKACGNVVEGTRFICFKVPLKKSVQTGIRDIKEIWDITALLNRIPNLGAVLDLTNTARYYKPMELQAAGVLHKKILIPGRIVPPESQVTAFMDAVDEILLKEGDFLIGVHCTHGLNRTGYMVCRYMRDRLGIPAKDAIKRFEKARGYQIERENYVADLLGKPPLPPDVGKHTTMKPVSNKYSRSPLSDEDYVEQQHRDRFSRPHNKGNNYGNRSTSNNLNYNWRERGNQSDRSDRTSSSGSRSSSSYDFRYDY